MPPAHAPLTAFTSAKELADLRRATITLSRRFLIPNALIFAMMLVLPCVAGGLLAVGVVGSLNLGTLLVLGQAVLLLVTARSFDEKSRQGSRRGVRERGAGLMEPTQSQQPHAWSARPAQPWTTHDGPTPSEVPPLDRPYVGRGDNEREEGHGTVRSAENGRGTQ